MKRVVLPIELSSRSIEQKDTHTHQSRPCSEGYKVNSPADFFWVVVSLQFTVTPDAMVIFYFFFLTMTLGFFQALCNARMSKGEKNCEHTHSFYRSLLAYKRSDDENKCNNSLLDMVRMTSESLFECVNSMDEEFSCRFHERW